MVPKVDLLFHSNPKDHIHREDPPEEVPAVFVFSWAEITGYQTQICYLTVDIKDRFTEKINSIACISITTTNCLVNFINFTCKTSTAEEAWQSMIICLVPY